MFFRKLYQRVKRLEDEWEEEFAWLRRRIHKIGNMSECAHWYSLKDMWDGKFKFECMECGASYVKVISELTDKEKAIVVSVLGEDALKPKKN